METNIKNSLLYDTLIDICDYLIDKLEKKIKRLKEKIKVSKKIDNLLLEELKEDLSKSDDLKKQFKDRKRILKGLKGVSNV